MLKAIADLESLGFKSPCATMAEDLGVRRGENWHEMRNGKIIKTYTGVHKKLKATQTYCRAVGKEAASLVNAWVTEAGCRHHSA